ncbi:hypothetical protein THRCLA_21279 [Thraustotheca clavata]|uniref:Uncharacterized protein n=1 Tax=Thraustotheca clavata TaxID=74557 RepID=A0A1V9ZY61_9STRA|nr:hypothetical protein THRCLA_21279 [Thraustotheca clavata]
MWHHLPEIASVPRATVLSADSFDEEFKTLFKQTLSRPSYSMSTSPFVIDRDCTFDSMMTSYSQPIEIDYRRRRTCSMEEYDDRESRLRRKLNALDDEDEYEVDQKSENEPDDEIFMLEL